MTKIEKEKEIVAKMIMAYCRHKEGNRELCDNCKQLTEYAMHRLDKCPFQEKKTSCSKCKIHCYQPQYREQIRKVMRFSGPRMLFYYPLATLKHLMDF